MARFEGVEARSCSAPAPQTLERATTLGYVSCPSHAMTTRIDASTTQEKPLLDYEPFDIDGVPRPCFACASCSSPLALKDELVSKSFSGSGGPAYLFRTVCVARAVRSRRSAHDVGQLQYRDEAVGGEGVADRVRLVPIPLCEMSSGKAHRRHVIANLVCLGCDTQLGWKYVRR